MQTARPPLSEPLPPSVAPAGAGQLAILGVSIGNPFFTARNLEELLLLAAERYETNRIFIAEASARHTFQALGSTPEEAVRKARMRGNNLRNKCERVLDSHAAIRDRFEFVNWSQVSRTVEYRERLESLALLFSFDTEFRRDAELATRSVLEKRVEPDADSIAIGVRFLLEELAFLSASPEIYAAAHASYLYHQRWPIFEKLIRGSYREFASAAISYVCYGAEDAETLDACCQQRAGVRAPSAAGRPQRL